MSCPFCLAFGPIQPQSLFLFPRPCIFYGPNTDLDNPPPALQGFHHRLRGTHTAPELPYKPINLAQWPLFNCRRCRAFHRGCAESTASSTIRQPKRESTTRADSPTGCPTPYASNGQLSAMRTGLRSSGPTLPKHNQVHHSGVLKQVGSRTSHRGRPATRLRRSVGRSSTPTVYPRNDRHSCRPHNPGDWLVEVISERQLLQ